MYIYKHMFLYTPTMEAPAPTMFMAWLWGCKMSPSIHWVEGWVAYGSSLDALEKEKHLLLLPETVPSSW